MFPSNGRETFTITLDPDADGYVGRQCPALECEKYFKITLGTGLRGVTHCLCPYCGHRGERTDFHTREQVAYARKSTWTSRLKGRSASASVSRCLADLRRYRPTASGVWKLR